MNDILNPELTWIEGRCYRINDSAAGSIGFQEHDLYKNDVIYIEEDEDDDDIEVVMMDDNRCYSNIHVSRHYLGHIIGKRGAVKSRIEGDTKTDIKIPRHGEDKDIAIYGPCAANVKAAIRRINIIVTSSRHKQRYTHFISIPMNHPNIVKNFERFKEEVLCGTGKGLEESIFIRSQKLHITVGVMCLMDNQERLLASKLLTEANDNIIKPLLKEYSPMKIRIKGLSYMNDDPKEIDVLYGRVEEVDAPNGLLQNVVDAIVAHFCKAGFMKLERDYVKLHVTLMNTRYRNPKPINDEPSFRQTRTPFDGTEILANFSDYDFGVTELTEFRLSQRGTLGPDGYYQSTSVVSCC